MSFTSHAFTSLPLVHTLNPDFFETTTLTLLLAGSWMLSFRKFSCTMIPELVLHHIPEFRRFPKFVALQVHDSEPSRVRDSETSRVRESTSLCIRDFKTSWIPNSRSLWVLCPWKLTSQISLTSTFRGWRVFLNSPKGRTNSTKGRTKNYTYEQITWTNKLFFNSLSVIVLFWAEQKYSLWLNKNSLGPNKHIHLGRTNIFTRADQKFTWVGRANIFTKANQKFPRAEQIQAKNVHWTQTNVYKWANGT
jgi:hypothetical protein